MTHPTLDLDELARLTYSAVFSDACDAMGLRFQAVGSGLLPMTGDARTLLGWARPVHALPVDAVPARPYGPEIDYVDSLRPGDVAVADCGSSDVAFWGELFSTAAAARGARGAVIHGLIRDTRKIQALGFPVFARGTRPTDSLGRLSIVEQDSAVTVGSVVVERGDLVVADADGIVIVPAAAAPEAIERARVKAGTEHWARDLLAGGATLAQAWERFRVL